MNARYKLHLVRRRKIFLDINGTFVDQICDNDKLDSEVRTDLERSFYLFIKAVRLFHLRY